MANSTYSGYASQFDTFRQTEQQYIINNTPAGQPVPTFLPNSPSDLLTSGHAAVADLLGQNIYNVQQAAYASTATGSDLDNKAADYNVTRKLGVAASSQNFQLARNTAATQNVPVPAGTIITTIPTPTIAAVTFTTNSTVILPAGSTSITVSATCTEAGIAGNLQAGTQLLLASSTPGIDSVSLTADITNGIDQETDDALRTRVLNAISGVAFGSDAWYIQQVTAVTGVDSAYATTNSSQPNVIYIYVAGPNNTVPDQTTIQNVQSIFTKPGGKPQIDSPTVLAPTPLTIDISVTATAMPGADTTSVETSVESAISALLQKIPIAGQGYTTINGQQYQFNGNLYPSQIGSQITAQADVIDYSNLTINGVAGPLAITSDQLPQAGTVTVQVVTA